MSYLCSLTGTAIVGLDSVFSRFLLVSDFAFSTLTNTCFKAYSWAVIHPNPTCKYFLEYFTFHHCLLVKVYHYFYIVSLIVIHFLLE